MRLIALVTTVLLGLTAGFGPAGFGRAQAAETAVPETSVAAAPKK